MLKIGLTGGIGSGKTTVTQKFSSLGVPVIDADEISRELVKPGQPAFAEIVNEFGNKVLTTSGEIDRQYLRDLIFSDARSRVKLESILHPLIRLKMSRQIESLDNPYCIISIPLLIETGQADLADRILVLDVPRELQVRRTMERDNTSAEAVEAVITSQVDNQTRLSLADDVLNNSGDIKDLLQQVEALNEKYKALVSPQEESIETTNCMLNNKIQNTDTPETKETSNLFKPVEPFTPPGDEIVYELPLNEKIRTLIRLESLFDEMEHHLEGDTYWDSRSAINTFVALMNIFGRPEIKTDMLKELDRINAIVGKYMSKDMPNDSYIKQVQEEVNVAAKHLRAIEGQLGQGLKQNEFIMSIRQRDSIPGGALEMDVPAYGHWLNKNIESRCQDVRQWLSHYSQPQKALNLILTLIRNSGVVCDAVTKAGLYQHSLDTGVANQLVRVVVPKGAFYFPEISGGRQRFTVRFLKPNGFDRPVQIEQDMPFKLICCAL